ncbi:hypothetical protein LOK49_LG15G02480 [Camellia lanceoleosa]|uniref:Uncharacterized protein n=1 Tax=Camellia lanceoleosa TaxID=1840588 RepID=A0ACC0F5S8_9ERIC|nr:hypothetical protein LOK49_LG15G02480 [Camellia lanceoleosa]
MEIVMEMEANAAAEEAGEESPMELNTINTYGGFLNVFPDKLCGGDVADLTSADSSRLWPTYLQLNNSSLHPEASSKQNEKGM